MNLTTVQVSGKYLLCCFTFIFVLIYYRDIFLTIHGMEKNVRFWGIVLNFALNHILASLWKFKAHDLLIRHRIEKKNPRINKHMYLSLKD